MIIDLHEIIVFNRMLDSINARVRLEEKRRKTDWKQKKLRDSYTNQKMKQYKQIYNNNRTKHK